MLSYFLDLAGLLGLAGLLVWCSLRLWASRGDSRYLQWGAAMGATLLALVLTTASILTAVALVVMNTRTAPVPKLTVSRDPATIEHGEHIADGFCSSCHSLTGTLTGGSDLGKDFPVPIGSMVSANLTPRGPLSHWSDGEIFRAIRNALDKDGHWLMIMSYTNASKLSDRDIESVIAYIRSQPPDGQPTPQPADHLNLRGLLFLGAGMLPEARPVMAGVVTAPPKQPTARYGEYILSYQDCRVCHGQALTGGTPGQLPPIGPDLTMVRNWTSTQFIATLRTGTDPGGHQLRETMPWRTLARMDDVELTAIYNYLTASVSIARR